MKIPQKSKKEKPSNDVNTSSDGWLLAIKKIFLRFVVKDLNFNKMKCFTVR